MSIYCHFTSSESRITVVLFAQTYAVYNQSRIILATVGPLGIALIVMDGVSDSSICATIDTTCEPDRRDAD